MRAIAVVNELRNIQKYNFTLAPAEVFETAIKAVLAQECACCEYRIADMCTYADVHTFKKFNEEDT